MRFLGGICVYFGAVTIAVALVAPSGAQSVEQAPSDVEVVQVFSKFCLKAFPDELSLAGAAAAANAAALGTAEVARYLQGDLGKAWRLHTHQGSYIITHEQSPVLACAVRHVSSQGLTAPDGYMVVLREHALEAGETVATGRPQTLKDQSGNTVMVISHVMSKPAGPAEQFLLMLTLVHPNQDTRPAQDGYGAVEIRLVRQIVDH